jgi:hypothetical protein
MTESEKIMIALLIWNEGVVINNFNLTVFLKVLIFNSNCFINIEFFNFKSIILIVYVSKYGSHKWRFRLIMLS